MIHTTWVYEGQQPTAEELAELEAMEKMPINVEDIPEITDEEIQLAKKYGRKLMAKAQMNIVASV